MLWAQAASLARLGGSSGLSLALVRGSSEIVLAQGRCGGPPTAVCEHRA